MGVQTDYLKLIKPLAGSNNWGQSINQNFDKIDLGYKKINNSLKNVESRIGEFGTFSFIQEINSNNEIENIDNALFSQGVYKINGEFYSIKSNPTYDEYNKINYYNLSDLEKLTDSNKVYNVDSGAVKVGHMDDITGKFMESEIDSYQGEFYNDNDTAHKQFYEFPDFTAFYVQVPAIKNGSEYIQPALIAFGLEFVTGSILIKSTVVNNNQVETKIQKLKQSLGGYYRPSSSAQDPNTIIFTKEQASSSGDSVSITIPHNVFNGVETTRQVGGYSESDSFYKFNTGIQYANTTEGTNIITYRNISNIYFYLLDTNSYRQIAYIPYKLYLAGNMWYIYIDTTYLLTNNLYIAYTISEYQGA